MLASMLAAHGFGRDPGLVETAASLDALTGLEPPGAGSPYESAQAAIPGYYAKAQELEGQAARLEAAAQGLRADAAALDVAAAGARERTAAIYAAQAEALRAQAARMEQEAQALRQQAAEIRRLAALLGMQLVGHMDGWEYHIDGHDADETAFWD